MVIILLSIHSNPKHMHFCCLSVKQIVSGWDAELLGVSSGSKLCIWHYKLLFAGYGLIPEKHNYRCPISYTFFYFEFMLYLHVKLLRRSFLYGNELVNTVLDLNKLTKQTQPHRNRNATFSSILRYIRPMYIVWSLVRRRVTRRLTRFQTIYNVLKNSKIL